MEPELTITFPPELEQALDRMAQRLARREPLLRDISERMYKAVMDNFAQEGRPVKWLPVAREGKILQDSGRLASSIDTYSDNDRAVVGTNVIYARIQNQGGKTRPHEIRPKYKQALRFNGRYAAKVNHPGSTVPARPFLTLTGEDMQDIAQSIDDWLTGGL
ncbi:hypothetical protein NG99_04625 [Erwinia typographi]|uniref:Phage virion morphogenesis protein n=1 Tax=Erwinia typographi TaxID=371042 RepID=A0A0A3Z890_9GAMM|nr:phage virion morphogenesis protein [Erwinia typographi]KGT95307.1 hypothetical protein NG99_04625 [Erwinia typographi]